MTKPDEEKARAAATNRHALAKYEILESMEAGLVLTGPEVKSLRAGRVNLQEGFVRMDNGRAELWNVHISPYTQGGLHVVQEPLRTRKLLLHQREIEKWKGKMALKGLTVVPLEIYFSKRGYAKVRIALARGKKAPDRRDDIKRRDIEREARRDYGGKHRIK
jgi:SsrA-binding protein